MGKILKVYAICKQNLIVIFAMKYVGTFIYDTDSD